MSSSLIITVIVIYFLVLISISFLTTRKTDSSTFYTGNKSSKWYLVAYGMIGASLSGVTFISIPGWVEAQGFAYMQMVIGYMIGYAIIAFVLMPLYYKMNLTSIYGYLEQRYGSLTHKTGALFFILSRVLGASVRLFLVADVLDYFLLDAMGVPFNVTVLITLALIYVYTFKGGIKTIVWTDTLQTTFMLGALVIAIYLIYNNLGAELSWQGMDSFGITDWFVTDSVNQKMYWWKYVLSGVLVSVAMTGLDQDMMQKNLTCKNANEAKKNMITFSVVLFFVNLVFLALGALLFTYINNNPSLFAEFSSFEASKQGDRLFPLIALKSKLGIGLGITFLLGLIAAAYSSADSALTALTTSFNVDILGVNKSNNKKTEKQKNKQRNWVHFGMTLVLFITILLANEFKEENVVTTLFVMAGYTYGPLLGLFFFGILTKRKVPDLNALIIAILVPLCLIIFKPNIETLLGDYKMGFELLGINGLICFLLLYLSSSKSIKQASISSKH